MDEQNLNQKLNDMIAINVFIVFRSEITIDYRCKAVFSSNIQRITCYLNLVHDIIPQNLHFPAVHS